MQVAVPRTQVSIFRDDSLWLHNALYDLCLFAFPWIPFLIFIVYGLEWKHDFSFANNPHTFKYLMVFLFALSVSHRNYTYFVTYGNRSVYQSRKYLFTIYPLAVFTTIFVVRYVRHPLSMQVMVLVLAAWNIWHNIMQRHGLFRGYAHKLRHGLEQRKHAWLDFTLLWTMVLFAMALGTLLYLPMIKSYRITRPTVKLLGPFFESYPLPIAMVFGVLLLVVFGFWLQQELTLQVPFQKRIPRFCFLLSNAAIFSLCLINPVLGIFCLAFSHAIEYFAYVHVVQMKKTTGGQQHGIVTTMLWKHMLIGAIFLIGSQVLIYYNLLDLIRKKNIFLETFLTGTAAIHFFYDGIIWKKSKPKNRWAL